MTLIIGVVLLAAYHGWLALIIRIAIKEGKDMNMNRLAYLRGDGVEIALAPERLPQMKAVAKELGMRRLAPVHAEPSLNNDAEPVIVLQCCRCHSTGLPHEMLANLDGKPYNSYEHERCPEVK